MGERRRDHVVQHPRRATPAARASSGRTGAQRQPRRPARHSKRVVERRRALVRVALGGMVVIALLFVFGFPARSLLAQRHERARARAQLELLKDQNAKLERESKRLRDNAEIERIARERYGLVRPGETPYVVVPPSTTAPAPSTTAPKSATTHGPKP